MVNNVWVPIVLCGPTASGKSAFSLALARRLIAERQPAELVNADSMAVYRGMDIGTAKPTPAEQAEVPHHLLDIFDLQHRATVAQFQQLARAAIADCVSRGVQPILVGGSALYLRAIIDHFDFPGTDEKIRSHWETQLQRVGSPALHQLLANRDPAAAALMEPGNGRRIVRALEVLELTGRPYPARAPEFSYALPNVVQLGLDAPRDWVDERIAFRVQQMWDAGLVAEVQDLERNGLRTAVTASRALGYSQVLRFLAGEISIEQAFEQTVFGTRRFVRRQLSWWRRDPRIIWLDATLPGPELVDAAIAALQQHRKTLCET